MRSVPLTRFLCWRGETLVSLQPVAVAAMLVLWLLRRVGAIVTLVGMVEVGLLRRALANASASATTSVPALGVLRRRAAPFS